MSKIMHLGINENLPSADYHADCQFFSSSDYKTILESPALFYKTKILGEAKEEKSGEHFSEGSLLHTMILEPHLVNVEYAVFPGMRRQGIQYEEFKAANKGLTIVTQAQMSRVLALKRAFEANPIAVDLLKGSRPELTIVQEIFGVPTKVRCDFINVERGLIGDLKSSAFSSDLDSVRMAIAKWQYGLSAALYSAVAEQYFGRKFEFYWPFLSKSDLTCDVYRMSEATREKGLAACLKAAKIYKESKASGVWPEVVTKTDRVQDEVQEI